MIVNSLSTFGMLLILTYQLQTVMSYSALRTGLALIPFAIGAVVTAALIAPRLGKRIAPRWLITAGIVLSAAGLATLIGLTPASRYFPLIFAATLVEGVGTGLGGPAILRTAFGGVLAGDTGAASAAHSAAGQLGSSIGAALLSTIAATATIAYLATRAGRDHPDGDRPRLRRRDGLGRRHSPSHRRSRGLSRQRPGAPTISELTWPPGPPRLDSDG